MENASKALLIAGAILLVIAIIAIAVGIVSKTRGTIDVAGNQIDAMEVKMHNNQFTIYEGRVTGADVKECIAKALSNNSTTTNSAMRVKVTVAGTVRVNQAATSPIFDSSNIPSNNIYTGLTKINSQGIINEIEFTLVP